MPAETGDLRRSANPDRARDGRHGHQKAIPDLPSTPLETGIRENDAALHELQAAGRLDTSEIEQKLRQHGREAFEHFD